MEVDGFAGFGMSQSEGPIATFWIHEVSLRSYKAHIAFTAQTREQVDEFYNLAMQAGATDNGKPGIRDIYHPHYYGAFVLDLDGYNIEAVCHAPHN